MRDAIKRSARQGYIAYDPQEDTETVKPRVPSDFTDGYIAYDPQEDTETDWPNGAWDSLELVTSPTIRKRILKPKEAGTAGRVGTGGYIAYDPQEDTETEDLMTKLETHYRVTSPTIRKRILKLARAGRPILTGCSALHRLRSARGY